ncbi:MAG TPA: F0F1 ATP synthase subunit delta [Candidatus Saccharimonadales bacterium]|nr:F0F1 ATP synthase subunit delta [Candidatus Saccharimonadales bacterium]
MAKTIASLSLRTDNPKRLAKETAAYLLSENRTDELHSLMRDVQHYWTEEGIIEVRATSAFPITTEIRAEIKSKIKGVYPKARKIIIDERLDTNIIGGVKLELANQQMDISIRTELDRFKQLAQAGKD